MGFTGLARGATNDLAKAVFGITFVGAVVSFALHLLDRGPKL